MVDKRQPAAFIDRDGVINVERHHVYRIEDFEFLPGTVDGLRCLASQGFALVVVTNQGGVAKGLYTLADYETLTAHMRGRLAQSGVALAGIYHCPHHPRGSVATLARICDCRKPAPGLLLRAADELGLDLARSVMIGDKISDVEAGRAAGVLATILVESGHRLPDDTAALASFRGADLLAAAQWLARRPIESDHDPQRPRRRRLG